MPDLRKGDIVEIRFKTGDGKPAKLVPVEILHLTPRYLRVQLTKAVSAEYPKGYQWIMGWIDLPGHEPVAEAG